MSARSDHLTALADVIWRLQLEAHESKGQLATLRIWATTFTPEEQTWSYAEAKAEVRRILGLTTKERSP